MGWDGVDMGLKCRTQLCCWVARKKCCQKDERGQLSLKDTVAMLSAA